MASSVFFAGSNLVSLSCVASHFFGVMNSGHNNYPSLLLWIIILGSHGCNVRGQSLQHTLQQGFMIQPMVYVTATVYLTARIHLTARVHL